MKKCIRVLCMLLVAGCMVQAADPLGYGLVYDPTRVDSVNYMLGLETDGYDPSDFQMNSGQEWVPLPIPTDSPFHPSNSAVGSISAPSQDKGDDGGPAEYFGDDCDNSMEMEPQQDDDGKGEEEGEEDDDGNQSQVEYFGNDCDSMGMEPQQNHDATQIQIVADQNQLQQAVQCYNCSFCTYATDHEGFFNRHVRRHTGGKVYECQFCKKNVLIVMI